MRGTEEIIGKLRGKGLKVTPQRLAVLDALKGNKTHPSAEKVYQRVQKICPTISFTTVYKTLEALAEMGDVNVLSCDKTRSRFDPDTSVHHHAVCDKCKSIFDVMEMLPKNIDLTATSVNGFKVQKAQVYFYGLCRRCQ